MARRKKKNQDETIKNEQEIIETKEEQEVAESEKQQEEQKVEPKPDKKEEAIKPKPKHSKLLEEHYNKYIEFLKQHRPRDAAKALAAMFQEVLNKKDVNNYNFLLKKFEQDGSLLSERYALQGLEVLNLQTRGKVEILYVMFKALSTKTKIPIDFNRARQILKDENIIKWFINKFERL